jgi:hypothetical protein
MPFMSIAPLSILAVLISVVAHYLLYRRAPEPKKNVSVARYLVVSLAVGAGGYAAGTAAGIAAACSSADAGNLCGLIGVFIVGPLLSAVAVLLYTHMWTRAARRAP